MLEALIWIVERYVPGLVSTWSRRENGQYLVRMAARVATSAAEEDSRAPAPEILHRECLRAVSIGSLMKIR